MEKLKKILVAYDGSLHSKSALDWAIRLGKDVGAELELVKVFEPIVRQYDVTKIQWTSKIPRSLTHSQLCWGLSTILCKHSYSRTLATEYIPPNDLQNKSRTELVSIPSFEFARSTFS